ncbi:MAG: ABC transporter ATP-binding protein [bacterium]
MIDISHVGQRFGGVIALRDVSAKIDQGEMVGLIGPSGAGKTTLLRILACYHMPSEGTVSIDGHSTLHASLAARRVIGYLPERDPVYGEMRVMEYLMFRARLKGLVGRARQKRLRELVGRCGLAGLERALMGKLSKGEVRRVLLADCLVNDPPVILMDEPTLGLDPLNTERIRSLLANLRGDHTVVFSSHDMTEAETLCGRILVMDRGRLAASGTPAELMAGYQAQNLGQVVMAVARKGATP